ncbi:MAG TPA: alpha-ketoacid dehydrogenase subunit beta [Gammaproteobacteria bacterium]|nr:alpha-ketoacid dehydrogenase subunit beta [Gammaproteobacteria bacterium]
MSKKSFRHAITEAIRHEMERDPTVIFFGEDIVGGFGGSANKRGASGGIMGTTVGLYEQFGEKRIFDTPISESAIMGAAAGAALTGLRPIAELMFADFLGVCFDQIFNQAAKFRYMFGGNAKTPMVIRMMTGAGFGAAAQHSQALWPIFTHIPGLKVVLPSNPYDAKGLLIQAIRDDDPVIFMEHKVMYDDMAEVPDEAYTIPFGEANVTRAGDDVTVVAFGRMVQFANKAADKLAGKISLDVIDPRTTSPMDTETIIESVEHTGRLVVVDEAYPLCSTASEVISMVAEHALKALKTAPVKVTPPHTPVPAAPGLEALYVPSVETIEKAVHKAMAG